MPTGFINSIASKSKVHTIRGNYNLWKKRFDEIDNGNAVLSVRYWSGKPYRSNQIERFVFNRHEGIGIERIILNHNNVVDGDCVIIGDRVFDKDICKVLSNQDGLSLFDFNEWFSKYDKTKEMAIIHFTDFMYGNSAN